MIKTIEVKININDLNPNVCGDECKMLDRDGFGSLDCRLFGTELVINEEYTVLRCRDCISVKGKFNH